MNPPYAESASKCIQANIAECHYGQSDFTVNLGHTSHQKIVIFNQVYAITSSPPETPNEKLFLKRFGDFISDTMNKLRDPPDPTRPQDVW